MPTSSCYYYSYRIALRVSGETATCKTAANVTVATNMSGRLKEFNLVFCLLQMWNDVGGSFPLYEFRDSLAGNVPDTTSEEVLAI